MSDPTPNFTTDNIDYAHTPAVARLHAAAAREKSEPVTQTPPISMGMMLTVMGFVLGLGLVAGGYFLSNMGTISHPDISDSRGFGYPPVLPEGADGPAPPPSDEKLHEPEMWIAQGKAAFGTNCAACHQLHGEGIPGQFPPLKGSEFVIHGEKRLIAILMHGVTGSLSVNGKSFNGVMEPLGGKVGKKMTAQILSYIRNEWGNKGSLIYEDQIDALMKELGTRPSYNEAELRSIPEDANAPASSWPEKLKGGGAPAAAPAKPNPTAK